MATAVTALTAMAVMLWLAPAAGSGRVHQGLLYTTRECYVASPSAATALTIAMGIVTALMLLVLNKVYTFIRTVTALQATLLAAMLAAWPAAAVCGTAMLLPLLFTVLVIIVYESYEQPASQRRCLTAAAVISTGCLFDYAYAVLLPPVLVGFINAKAMNLKTVLATVLGLVAPPWIALATGSAHLADINIPRMAPLWLSAAPTVAQAVLLAMMLVTLVLIVVNIASTESNRLVLRVHHSLFHLAAIAAMGAIVVDTESAAVFVPLLAMATAHEVTQRFALSKAAARGLLPLLVIIVSVALYCYSALTSWLPI